MNVADVENVGKKNDLLMPLQWPKGHNKIIIEFLVLFILF